MQLEINNYSVYMKKSTVIYNVFDYVVELSIFFFFFQKCGQYT